MADPPLDLDVLGVRHSRDPPSKMRTNPPPRNLRAGPRQEGASGCAWCTPPATWSVVEAVFRGSLAGGTLGYPSDMAGLHAATVRSAARSGVRLELVTVVWMVAEATLAIGAGVVARSVLLTAFGADSVIELLSGGLLLWRLEAESRRGDLERVERTEVTATRLSAALLVALCLYVVATTAAGLLAHVEPDRSFLGLGVAAAAVVVMPALAQGKRRVNRVLESAALRADIAETTVCAGMAATVLLGVTLHATLGWWWAEYVAAVGLLGWLVVETREVLEAARAGRAGCCGDD